MSGRVANLIIPGACKSGTSSLHTYLGRHADIFMSQRKEPHFFSSDDYFEQGSGAYAELFEESGSARILGESSTTYMIFPNVIERIADTLEDPRFIFALRNPVERVESHHRWLQALGLEDLPLKQAFMYDRGDAPDFRASRQGDKGNKFGYYDQESRYGTHIERFITQFGRDRVLVITTETLASDPQSTLDQCARFLGVAPFTGVETVWDNATPDRGQDRIADDDRRWLRGFFVEEVARLREITGMPFDEWEQDYPMDSTLHAR